MMNRKMKQLALAVGVALGSAGLLPSAQAVYVSPDKLGQALIFPYYTVRAGWNTLIGVTNTTDLVVAVKVRFREAYNSRDVLDFNVILSPQDLWNATVYDDGSGRPVLGINPDENTCTVGLDSKAQAFPGPYSYVNSPITGVNAVDGGPTTLERMRSGYVEMIMMGAASPTSPLGRLAVHGDDESDPPADCARLSKIFRATADSGYATPAAALAAINTDFNRYPTNALSGLFSLVNGVKGFNAMGRATHLAYFRTPDAPAGTRNTLHRGPSATVPFENSWHEPSLNAANTQGTYITAPQALFAGNASGAAAVTSALQAAAVSNEWSRNPTGQIPGGTSFITSSDWVITYPTKNFYVDTATHEYAGRATVYGGRQNLPAVFPAPFAQTFSNGASCDRAELLVYNREEDPVDVEIPSPGPGFQLCREVNVLTFNEGELLGNLGDDAVQIYYPDTFLYGWMRVSFDAALPALGFSIQSRDDGGGLLTEAALYDHSIVRPAAPPTGGQ
jgi:hypothetical protein